MGNRQCLIPQSVSGTEKNSGKNRNWQLAPRLRPRLSPVLWFSTSHNHLTKWICPFSHSLGTVGGRGGGIFHKTPPTARFSFHRVLSFSARFLVDAAPTPAPLLFGKVESLCDMRCMRLRWGSCLKEYGLSIIIIINPLTARVVGAPQIILQPVFSIFPCSPLPSGTCRTPGLSIP